MSNNRVILILIGIGITLFFLVSFIGSKSPLDIFNSSLGVMIILFVFYNEDKKINYLIALFCVNIVQWIILIYTFFNNFAFIKTGFYYYLIGAPFFTIVLVNLIRKNHLKPSKKAKVGILKDKKKLMLLFTSAIIIIGGLAGFIVYYAPIFLYVITLGLMIFTYGFYHEDKKVNVSVKYVGTMVSVLILQFFILIYFSRQFAVEDLSTAFTFSLTIAILLSIQIYRSDLTISNEKKETIIGIGAIIAFIVFFAALILK